VSIANEAGDRQRKSDLIEQEVPLGLGVVAMLLKSGNRLPTLG
jgi:hypothetical protein